MSDNSTAVTIAALCSVPVGLISMGYMLCGSVESPLYKLFGINPPHTEIAGYVAPGYESVCEAFSKIIRDGMEDNAQVCAYVNGRKVVDLIGIYDKRKEHSKNYSHDTIQNVFSSTKAVTSVVIAILVDRGYLSYDTKIAQIWPQFSEHGKDSITIEDLMKHESGLHKFDFTLSTIELNRQVLKDPTRNTVCNKIASSKSKRLLANSGIPNDSENISHRHYHFVTRGFIINEIVMRVDPLQRTVGEFIRDEIVSPLGIPAGFTLGDETILHEQKICPLRTNSFAWILGQIFSIFHRKVNIVSLLYQSISLNVKYAYFALKYILGPNYSKPSVAVLNEETNTFHNFSIAELFNHPTMRAAEAPSCNGHASARGMALIASVMANHGSTYEPLLCDRSDVSSPKVQLFRHETSLLSHGNVTFKYDNALFGKTKFNSGGWNVFDTNFAYNRQGSVGWFGIGGSCLQWHHEYKIGFGYACNLIGADLGNGNSALVQNELINCVKRLSA